MTIPHRGYCDLTLSMYHRGMRGYCYSKIVYCPDCGMELKARGKGHIGSKACWGSELQITNDYLKRVWKYWHQANKGSRFKLSPPELLRLLDEAGITIDQVGRSGYHLARYGDTGDYVIGNCRFIPVAENIAERKLSDSGRRRIKETRNPVGNAIETPYGEFLSLKAGARAIGMTSNGLKGRIKSTDPKWSQWKYKG